MSRIRRLSYAISDRGRRATPVQQAARIRDSVLSILEEVNQSAQSSRRITKKAAFTVVLRSLQTTRNLPFSLREHMALKELSQYINLAQNNKSNSLTLSHTDLLPISHPRSTREHSLTASALREARTRWFVDDSRITDDSARAILASALNAEVDSVEHTYFTSMLSALPQGTIPADALLAAIGDGNSPIARSLRANLQRRDRLGRFAYMGGGLRALIRRGSQVFSLVGRTLMDTPDGKVLIELPDGRIAKITPERGEYVKAILNPTKDGFSTKPVRVSVTDDVIDEADLEFVDSPEGWEKIGENLWRNIENPEWEVRKMQDRNGETFFSAQRPFGKGGHVQALGGIRPGERNRNWADVLDALDEFERKQKRDEEEFRKEQADRKAKGALKIPRDEAEVKPFNFDYPEGAFKLKMGDMYEPQGRVESDAPRDFTDDPAAIAQMFDPRDIRAALEEAVLPQGKNENAFGYGKLDFEGGEGLVDAGALYNALDEAGEDADLELAKIYDKGKGNDDNEKALLDSRKGPEQVDQSKPDVAEAFERVTKEGTPDVEPAAEVPAFEEEKRDEAPLPPLLEGLSENELARFMESKDHTPHLPKNKDIDVPEGYNKLDPAPFQAWREVNADNPDPVLPEGFSDNPVFIAQNVPQEELKKELRRAIEPGNEAPGYGAIKLQTEDGEEFAANVPGEAIRDALQLQGVDTDAEIQKIADEGKKPEPTADEVKAMLDAEPVEEAEAEKPEVPSILDMMKEEEDLIQEFLDEGMTQGDAQGAAAAQMRIKYGTSPDEELMKLPREEGLRILEENQKRIDAEDAARAVVEKVNVRPKTPEDFEVDKIEEIPDGIAEYPKPANVAPPAIQALPEAEVVEVKEQQDAPAAPPPPPPPPPPGGPGGPGGPIRITVKVSELQPGDITVGDHFVITEIGEKVPNTDRVKIKGYYPGHVEQDTKQWNEWREITVIRGATPPDRGDLPVLSKPKEKEFGRRKKNADGTWGFVNPDDQARFDAAMAEYNVQLDAAKKRWVDPTEPANQPHRVISRAADLKAGDVTTDPKKGHFVIERVFTDENTKPGFVSVEGYYPGHVTQRKEWKVDTPIDVIRNVEAPAKGDLPELHQPHKIVDGKWRPDKDPAKRAEHQKMLDEAAGRWKAPENLPIIDNKDNDAEPDKDIPNAVAIPRPVAPRLIEMPAFQGEMANLVRQAEGDWNKLRELLKDKVLIFFDFETTGVQPEDGNEPWQVAAVKVVNGKVVDRINVFMNPGRSIANTFAGRDTDGVPNAVDADGNKLTDEFLAKQPNQEEAMRQFMEWVGPDAILGAQNLAFDEEIARRLADRFGIEWNPAGFIDTLPMARDIFKDQPKENRPKTPKGRESYALGNLAKFLGVDLENWHAADADAEAAAQIFDALIAKGIELDAGKDLFDVDARNDEYIAKLDQYNKDFADYEDRLAQFAAAKALQDGLQGKEVNADDAVKAATPAKAERVEVDAGPVGAEPEPIRGKPETVVLDFTPNVDFPRGKMILKDRDWALDDANTVLLPRENVRMRDLLPGDFMQSKDGNTVWQVVAVRGGEEFGLKPGRIKVYRVNIENGELSTYEHFHGVFLDGVRRPINPRDLDAPETVAPDQAAPVIINEPENPAKIEEESKPGDKIYRKSVDIGGFADGYIRISKNKDGKYTAIVGIVDNNDEAIYSFSQDYRTYEGALAEAEAILKERADELIAERRAGAAEPEEARAKDVPVSRGDIPANAGDAAEIVEVENLPNDITGQVKIADVGDEKPDYQADAVVKDVDGDVIAHQTTNHPNKSAAEKEGRDFVNRAVEAIQNPEPIAEEKPKREKKPLTEEQIRAAEEKEAQEKDNAWVEGNAGKIPPIEAIEIKKGDFLWEPFWGNYAEVLDAKYIGYLDRVEIQVLNRVNGKIENRFLKADSPIRNVRRLGVSDQEFEIPEERKGTNRGAKRGVIKRKPLEERVVAKEGRPMGGRFDIEGFFKDKNGRSAKPGDVINHPKLGRGVVKKLEGAQVEEGKKAGGIVRKGKVYLDHIMIQFENEKEPWAINQGGRVLKAKNIEILDNIDDPIILPAFRGGRAVPNLVPERLAPKPPLPRVESDQEAKKVRARQLGREAFARGGRGNQLPANDKEFMEMWEFGPAGPDKAELWNEWLAGFKEAEGGAPADVEPQEPARVQGQRIRALVDRKLGRDKEEDLREQIEQAIADGDAIAFRYNGKVRNFAPKRIWTNPQNGNINVGGFENGQMKNFTIQKMDFMPTDENGLVQDMPAEVPVPEKVNADAKLEKFKADFGNKFDNLENRSDVAAGFQDIANALPKAKNYKAPRNLRGAREAIDEINSSLARGAGIDEISEYNLDAAIRRLRRESNDPLALDMADKLEKVSNEIKARRQELIDKRLNAPLPEMPQAKDLDKDNLKNAINEIIQRLPDYGQRGQSSADKEAGIERDRLRKYLQGVDQEFFDLDELTHGELKEAADRLRKIADQEAKDGNEVKANKYTNFADLLEGYHKELESREDAGAPVVKEPLNKLNPEEVAQQRIADRANEFAPSEKLRAFMADDLNLDNDPLLQPFKDELQEFFANNEPKPLAMLSPAARQALGFFIGKELKGPNKSIDPDMSEDVVNNLGDLAFQLRAERLAFTPNAPDLGVGDALLDMDFSEIRKLGDFLNQNRIDKEVKLKINGQDTGFNIKVAMGQDRGVNTTYFITHRATGRKFVMKLDTMVGERGADAEIAAAALNRALGNVGAYQVFRHRKNKSVIVTSWAGEMADLEAEPKRIGDTKYLNRHEDAAMDGAFLDVIGLNIMDAILINGDRHRSNLLVGRVRNLEGVNPTDDTEAVQFMAVDHGLAAAIVRGFNVSPDAYIDGASGDDSHRKAVNIAARLVNMIGPDLYKKITDMTVQQAIQALQRERGGDIKDADLDLLIERLELLRGIDISKWKKILKKR